MMNIANSITLLNEMKALLHTYSRGRLPLNSLIQRLETLSDALTSPSHEWRTRFFALWLGLEEVNALLLDGEKREPNSEEQHELDDRLKNLSSLIDSEIKELVPK